MVDGQRHAPAAFIYIYIYIHTHTHTCVCLYVDSAKSEQGFPLFVSERVSVCVCVCVRAGSRTLNNTTLYIIPQIFVHALN